LPKTARLFCCERRGNAINREEWQNKNFSFFQNSECEYFPCHKTGNPSEFNCLFCFCPLYLLEDCGGTFTLFKHRREQPSVRDCSSCLRPHRKNSYGLIMERLTSVTSGGECQFKHEKRKEKT
jgi:Zn-finger protein